MHRPATAHNPFGPANTRHAPGPEAWEGPADLDATLHVVPAVAALTAEAYTALRTSAAAHLNDSAGITRTAFAKYINHTLESLH